MKVIGCLIIMVISGLITLSAFGKGLMEQERDNDPARRKKRTYANVKGAPVRTDYNGGGCWFILGIMFLLFTLMLFEWLMELLEW